MGMIPLLVWRFSHRPIPCHLHPTGADDRYHMRRAGVAVLGEELAADFDANFAILLFDIYGTESGGSEESEGKTRESEFRDNTRGS